ncbi:Retrovirus-related Pol polyprotein from transposon TNT 1-94 [Podarcis lilfordi]|uniref:Retrovirus-related Pol polyprotein from transposon TNT 1-94 n=1 Tax=Podarcis lilfordi TaxID=74358 RepID=A0AA35PT15_9SAUR|nr:Retrovirus-related Pol polyprotein from transposon TNT 1-94 [Podarcis lilfordi]
MASVTFDSDARQGMPMLNEHNFVPWKERLIAFLDAKGVLDAVENLKPTGSSEEDLAKIKLWKLKNHNAKTIIFSQLQEKQLSMIDTESDASQILKDLEHICRGRTESPVRNAKIKDSNYASRQFTKSREMAKKVVCFNCNKEGHIAKNCKAPKTRNSQTFQPKRERKGKSECTLLLQERNLAVQNRENKRSKWIIDSGASSHFSFEKDYFNEINDDEGSEIETADGNIVKAKGAGSMDLKFYINDKSTKTTVSRVLYVPQLSCNLLSVSTLDRKGFQITFGNGECNVTKNGEVFVQAKLVNGVYEIDLSEEQSAKVARSSQKDEADLDLWHRRLGHRDTSLILDLQRKDLVKGLQVTQSNRVPRKCISCVTENFHFHVAQNREAPECLTLCTLTYVDL